MQVVGFMGPPVCSGVYSAVNSRDAMRGFAGGFGGCEQAKARNGAVARRERAADVPDRAGAGAGGGEAGGRRRADAGGAVHRRLAERKEQIPFVAAYFVPGCGGRSARAGGGGGRRRGHHDPRLGRWGTDGGRLDAGVYRGDGRGDGRNLGAGGGGHGDLDWGMIKRKRIAVLRDQAGLKQNELARKLAWSAAVLSRVESGKRALSDEELGIIFAGI